MTPPSPPRPPTVLIADPVPLFLLGMRLACDKLGTQPLTASDEDELAFLVEETRPSVMFASPRLWPSGGVERCAEVAQRRVDLAVAIMADNWQRWELEEARERGLQGYVDKATLTSDTLADIVVALLRGEAVFKEPADPSALGSLISPREHEVLRLLACGLATREIASTLLMAERTAKATIGSAMRRLGAGNRAQAVAVGCALGLLEAPPPEQREPEPRRITSRPAQRRRAGTRRAG